MNVVEALFVALKLDGSQYQAGLEKAQRSLEAFAGKEQGVEKARDKAQREQARKQQEAERKASREREQQLRNAAEGYRRVRNEIIGMVGAAMGMAGIKSFVTNSVTGLVNVGRAATDLNMSARSVAAWGKTIEAVGGKSEDMIGTMRAMNLAVANAKEGFDVDSPFFAFLNNQGIRWQDTNGKLREMGDMLPEIADKFNKFRPEQQAILARQFGWSDDFVALMRKGSLEIRRIQSEKYKNEVISDADIKRAEKFREEWAKISNLFEKTGREVFLALVPSLEKLNALLLRFANWVSQNSDTISAFFVGVGNALTVAVDLLSGLDTATGGWSTKILAAVTALAALKVALGGILSLTGLPMLLKLMGGGGLAALGKLGLVGAAGAAGYGIGTWLNDRVVNPSVQALTGDKNATLGTWLYDKMNPDAGAAAAANGKPIARTTIGKNREERLMAAAQAAGITNPKELAHFMAQMAHESDGFKTLKEYASGRAYEGRVKDLGNTQPGDGVRFKGRGFVQLTGRANYTDFARDSGIDVVNNPELLEREDVAAQAAIWYWKRRVGERWRNGIKDVTRLINGGYNGLADRESYYAQYSNMLQRASPTQSVNNTSNRSDVQINGGITINTAATDAAGIANEIRPAVNRSLGGVSVLGVG